MAATEPELFRFRINKTGGNMPGATRWRVQTYDSEPPYGPGWSPLITGYRSLEEAQTEFPKQWHGVVFDNDSRLTGTFPSQDTDLISYTFIDGCPHCAMKAVSAA
jgi:hypothetical protein